MKNRNTNNKPLIGFFPLFYNLAETGHGVLIAKRYMEMGGQAIFFSHGGEYEYLAKEIGCEVIRVKPIYDKEYIDLLWKSSRLETYKNPFSTNILNEHVKEEVKAFKKTKIKMIVSDNNWPCRISARVANIPLISVAANFVHSYTKYPEDAEFIFTRFLPNWLKLIVINWLSPRSKFYVGSFRKISKKYGLEPPRYSIDINKGDYTFYTNYPEFLGINTKDIAEDEYYIGPLSLEELFTDKVDIKDIEKTERKIENHLNKKGKSILFSLGSSGTKELFLKILNVLDKTDYNVIAVYTSILKEEEIPDLSENIILEKYVPSIEKINKMVDLAIIHGGWSTVITAAISGKPVIGFPMQFEQHLNLEVLVRHNVGTIALKNKIKNGELKNLIDEIFDNYDYYYNNAQKLAKKLPPPKGDIRAAKKIIEIQKKEGII